MIEAGATRRPPEIRVGANGDALTPVSTARRSYAPDTVGWTVFALVAATAAAADGLAKDVVSDRLVYGVDRHLLGPLSLTHTTNSGIAFGLFPTRAGLAALLGLVILVGLVCFYARVGGDDARLAPAFGLLIGGSLGNLADRLRFGRVTDFVEVRFWPTFNLADLFILAGIVMLLLIFWRADSRRPFGSQRPPFESLQAR